MLQISSRRPRLWPALLTLTGLGILSAGPIQPTSAADTADEIASQWLEIVDTVLANHVDPPVRQEMLKTALQAVYKFAKQDTPPGLAIKISQLGGDDELQAFLRTTLAAAIEDNEFDPAEVREVGMGGLLATVSRG